MLSSFIQSLWRTQSKFLSLTKFLRIRFSIIQTTGAVAWSTSFPPCPASWSQLFADTPSSLKITKTRSWTSLKFWFQLTLEWKLRVWQLDQHCLRNLDCLLIRSWRSTCSLSSLLFTSTKTTPSQRRSPSSSWHPCGHLFLASSSITALSTLLKSATKFNLALSSRYSRLRERRSSK